VETQILVEELSPSVANLVTEASEDGKNAWLNGVFMQAELKNRNGRSYPLSEISQAVENANKVISETNGIFGELDHPQTLTINLDRISHVITEMRMDGNNAIGRAKLLETPMGNIARELVKSGVALGVSSRGAGAVTESGGVSGFQFVTVDIVAQPSAPGAYPSAVYESLQQARNGEHIQDFAEAIRHDPKAQKYFKEEILNWLKTGIFQKK
jgi:hypothetical protein